MQFLYEKKSVAYLCTPPFTNKNNEHPAIYDVTLENVQATAVMGVAWYNQYVGASFALTAKTPDYKEATSDIYSTGGISLFAFF